MSYEVEGGRLARRAQSRQAFPDSRARRSRTKSVERSLQQILKASGLPDKIPFHTGLCAWQGFMVVGVGRRIEARFRAACVGLTAQIDKDGRLCSDLKSRRIRGARALESASASGKLVVVKLLIEQGVDGSSRVWT